MKVCRHQKDKKEKKGLRMSKKKQKWRKGRDLGSVKKAWKNER